MLHICFMFRVVFLEEGKKSIVTFAASKGLLCTLTSIPGLAGKKKKNTPPQYDAANMSVQGDYTALILSKAFVFFLSFMSSLLLYLACGKL